MRETSKPNYSQLLCGYQITNIGKISSCLLKITEKVEGNSILPLVFN